MSETWQEKRSRVRQERENHKVLRGQRANTFLEVLTARMGNTSGEVKDLGWFLWESFYITSGYRHLRRYASRYPWGMNWKEKREKEREKYEKRFQEAVDEWGSGRKSRRFGVNFLAFVCGVNKGTVSRKIDDWAYHYRHAMGHQTPEEIAQSHGFDLLFADPDEYERLAEECDDVLDFGNKAEKRVQEIREEKKRHKALLEKVSQNVIIPKEKGARS